MSTRENKRLIARTPFAITKSVANILAKILREDRGQTDIK